MLKYFQYVQKGSSLPVEIESLENYDASKSGLSRMGKMLLLYAVIRIMTSIK
jgi:hypothetical protein